HLDRRRVLLGGRDDLRLRLLEPQDLGLVVALLALRAGGRSRLLDARGIEIDEGLVLGLVVAPGGPRVLAAPALGARCDHHLHLVVLLLGRGLVLVLVLVLLAVLVGLVLA